MWNAESLVGPGLLQIFAAIKPDFIYLDSQSPLLVWMYLCAAVWIGFSLRFSLAALLSIRSVFASGYILFAFILRGPVFGFIPVYAAVCLAYVMVALWFLKPAFLGLF